MPTGKTRRVVDFVNASGIRASMFDGTTGVLFPEEDVFEFDLALFESLRRAFDSHDESELQRLWAQARPLELTAEQA